MRMDLSCPAEVWQYAMPREDYPACDMTLYNLSDKTIASVEVTLLFYDQEGEEQARQIYRAHSLKGLSGQTFRMTAPVESKVKPHRMEVLIEKVWHEDNSVWRRDRDAMVEYTPNALPNSRSLEMLRYVAGSAAVGYPQEQDNVWMCVCGRPNHKQARTCRRCRRDKEEIFTRYNREAIDKLVTQRHKQLDLQAKAAREDASRLQAEREKEYNRRRRRRRRIIAAVLCVALLAGAAYGVVGHLLPHLRYQSAAEIMAQGNWAEAEAAFLAMEDYRDAPQQAIACRYQAARASMDGANEATLEAARATFAELGADYEDCSALILETDYRRAGIMLTQGRLDEASALYTALGAYRDSAAMVKRCAYLNAERLLVLRDYEAAREAYLALGDYEDSAVKAREAVYLPAVAALESGDPEAALALFAQIPGYRDADERVKAAHYARGVILRDAGDMDAAGDAFLQAGDHQDAAEQASGCIYAPAVEAMEQGDLIRASELFAKIPDYQDAQAKWQACTYQLGKKALSDMEFGLAADYLSQLDDSYEDVLDLKLECDYLAAQAALDRGDYQQAVDGFTRVLGYRNANKLLNKARYQLAGQLAEGGDYLSAIAQYELLGDYEDSEKQIKLARYSRGQQLLTTGAFEEAEALFAALGNYKNAAEKVEEARYGLADQLLNAGRHEEARPLFADLGDYADAPRRVMECDYISARALLEAGNAEEGIALFESIAGFDDAADQAAAACYAEALKAEAAGQQLTAADWFLRAGAHEDAPQRAQAIHDAYYQPVRDAAQEAVAREEYPLAVELLSALDLTRLPPAYAELATQAKEYTYLAGDQLWQQGRVYEARRYLEAVADDPRVDGRLDHLCYRIIGLWQDEDGATYAFTEDGRCDVAGESLTFAVEEVLGESVISIGPDAATLRPALRIASVTDNTATLYDIRDGATRKLNLKRAEPLATPAPTPAPSDESFAVVDEE